MIDVEIMQDSSEVVHYDQTKIPLYIRIGRLSDYPNKRALCHWHDDVEFIHILSGKMNYYINGNRLLLNEHDSIMVNTRQMHYGYSYHQQDCHFICILFHPRLFTGNELLYNQYILPILENQSLEYFYFDSTKQCGLEAEAFIQRISYLKNTAAAAYELEIVGVIHIFWSRLGQYSEIVSSDMSERACPDYKIQRDMVSYIHQRYAEKISLSDIAAAGSVCRSKCCAIFKHDLQQSPMEFLNSYRLKVSCGLLVNTTENITQIALNCGFNHLSYYSKLFMRCYGCTPSQYRSLYTRLPPE